MIISVTFFLVQQTVRGLQNTLASEMAQIETLLINGEASESSVSALVCCQGDL